MTAPKKTISVRVYEETWERLKKRIAGKRGMTLMQLIDELSRIK